MAFPQPNSENAPGNVALEDPLDLDLDLNPFVMATNSATGVLMLPAVTWNLGNSPFHTSTPTCLLGSTDADGYDLICFCTRCQDSFLAQSDRSAPNSAPSMLGGWGCDFTESVQVTDTSKHSASSSTVASSRPRSKRRRKTNSSSGITKPMATAHNVRPEVLIDQLEVALHGDEKTSADFKWKASVLFQELKRLIESETANQQLRNADQGSPNELPLFSQCRSRKKATKQSASKAQGHEKIFLCTWASCTYSTSSAMDWKRHEETHWPQQRYLCIQCPLSIADSDSSNCTFCTIVLSATDGVDKHYLQCESARRNGRTFARKDKLSEHLQKDHSIPPSSALSRASKWTFRVDSGWPRRCGFCDILFDSWDDRAEHLMENHFKRGADHRLWHRSYPPVERCLIIPPQEVDTSYFDLDFTSALGTNGFTLHPPPQRVTHQISSDSGYPSSIMATPYLAHQRLKPRSQREVTTGQMTFNATIVEPTMTRARSIDEITKVVSQQEEKYNYLYDEDILNSGQCSYKPRTQQLPTAFEFSQQNNSRSLGRWQPSSIEGVPVSTRTRAQTLRGQDMQDLEDQELDRRSRASIKKNLVSSRLKKFLRLTPQIKSRTKKREERDNGDAEPSKRSRDLQTHEPLLLAQQQVDEETLSTAIAAMSMNEKSTQEVKKADSNAKFAQKSDSRLDRVQHRPKFKPAIDRKDLSTTSEPDPRYILPPLNF